MADRVHLIAGLGNPGPEYASHRHNIGFMVADRLADRWRLGTLRSKFGALVGVGDFAGERVVLVKPQEYMNLSGQPVQRVADFYQVPPTQVIVVHDEIDLEFGRLKVKVGGGHGGHNGLRSLAQNIGPAFIRVRCGVGHPGSKDRVVGHVLGTFSKAESAEVPLLIERAADAVETLLKSGVQAAMNNFNQKDT
ncbi:MAG TPA: aminoacyl-tRNA hydrolase [Polyangia bacterium]|nr:aminoacyl-tRNA hydrolase [Polyangia bacterium]